MKRNILIRTCVVGVLSALLSGLLIFGVMYLRFGQELRTTVRQTAQLLIDTLNANEADDTTALLTQKNANMRITLVDPAGTVLFDNEAELLENHADRPEIKAALLGGAGEDTRLSETLKKQTYYYALRTTNGNVLRTAAATDSALTSLWACLPYALLAVAVVSALSMLTARSLTRQLLAPINAIDVEHPLQNETYDELTPLLLRLEKQNNELAAQMKTVERMRDDLADIMENMAEGLMVLSRAGTVLSVNQAALSLLGKARGDCLGQPLLALQRGEAFTQMQLQLEQGKNAVTDVPLGGRCYEATLSQAQQGGAILLLVDVTEKRAAEQMRREFSANVSHELKTPLQAISGYAELLQSGMVQPADRDKFIGTIHAESKHLIALVEDIIHLSRLDEGGKELPRERVELFALAQQVTQHLQHKAEDLQVKLEVGGASAQVLGVPRLLEETLFNLVDNAVTYNKPGGSVRIEVIPGQTRTVLRVADTGIGIPESDRARVFERFYRVDKSHSRATGGTGLGLSIVKHSAQLHGAQLQLESTEGVGTTVTLSFAPVPKEASEEV